MDTTPTRRSKRKCTSSYASPVAPFQHKKGKISKGLKVKASDGISTTSLDPDTLVQQCILSLIPHNWYRIFPLCTGQNRKCDDFAFSAGQSWQNLCPVLLDQGYILDVTGEFEVVMSKWGGLSQTFDSDQKLHFSIARS